MLYIIENIDLNQEAFNFNTNYHVISDHGPLGGYLQMLPNEIRGVKYHSIKIIREPNGLDLEEALAFSKNHMLNLFAILKRLDFKTMMLFFLLRFKPLKQTIKESWFEFLGCHKFESPSPTSWSWEASGKQNSTPFVNPDACRRNFRNFRLKGNLEWEDKLLKDLWAMKTWNKFYQETYCDILQLAKIPRCQCISTTTFERALCIILLNPNTIMIWEQNTLGSVLRVMFDVPTRNIDHILVEAIELWGNPTK